MQQSFRFRRRILSLFGISLLLLFILGISPFPAVASMDYYRSTRETVLVQALEMLSQSSARDWVRFMLEQNVKILFKDMRELGKIYSQHDALTWVSDEGQQMIYINRKHESAPPQALAALIGHEVMHSDRDNSIEEEFAAWQQEGRIWKEMQGRYPEMKQIPLRQVPLVDRLNAILLLEERNQLQQEIRGNMAYRDLPQRSPGF